MDNKEEQKKKIKKVLLIWLLIIGVFLVPFSVGIYYMDCQNYPVGVSLFCIGLAGFLAGIVYVCITAKRIWKVIFTQAEAKMMDSIKRQENKEEFLSSENQKIVFGEGGFWRDDAWCSLADYFCFVILENKVWANYTLGIMFIKKDDEDAFTIPLDKDLLDKLQEQGAVIENQEDFEYFQENPTACFKKIRHQAAFHPAPFQLLRFAKNKKEKREAKKGVFISICVMIGFFIAAIGFTVLMQWLGDSKTGIALSKKVGLHWWFKAIFTIGILLAVGLMKKEKWYVRIVAVLYLVGYWITLFISYQAVVLWDCISLFGFLGLTLFLLYQKPTEEEKRNSGVISPALAVWCWLVLMLNYEDYDFAEESIMWILFGVFSGIALVLCIGFSFWYFKVKKENRNKKFIAVYTLSAFFVVLFSGLVASMAVVPGLNFAFDFSEPIQEEHTIERLKEADKYSSPKAVILIGDKEIEIAVSKEKYYELEAGDTILIYKCQGAFHIGYYYYAE